MLMFEGMIYLSMIDDCNGNIWFLTSALSIRDALLNILGYHYPCTM